MNIETRLCGFDFAVIAVYFAITLASGLFMGRFVKSSKDFFSGGKKVPWWMGAVSSYMAMISSFVFIAHAGVAYQDGLVAILVFWSTVFAIVAGSWIFAWRWQRAKVTTPMEYLEQRYGPDVRQVISWCGIAFRVLDNMVRLYSLGLIASVLLNIPLSAGIWLGVLIVLAYTLTGGLWSVLVTDMIQCTILFVAAVAMLFLSLNAVGGLGALSQSLPDHFNAFNGHRGSFMFLFAYYLIVFIKYNGNWAFIQRLESVPDEKSAIKMGLLTAVLLGVFPVVALLPAIAARHMLPGINPEEAYLTLCTKLLPPGALGLMVSAMLAATLSTLASEFNVTSSVFSKDIYQRLIRPSAGAKEMLFVGRFGMVAVAALVAVGAQFVTALGGAFEANKLLMALFGVPIVIPSVFGILWRRPNTKGVYACIVGGVIGGFLFKNVIGMSWEGATIAQTAVCLAAYWLGGFLPTSARERQGRDALFALLEQRHAKPTGRLLLCLIFFMGMICLAFGAETSTTSGVMADFTRETGCLRRALHSASWAPRSSVRAFRNDDNDIAAMNLTYARTHDWALINAGQPVIDYQLIFPLQHLDAADPKNYIFKPSDHLINLARNVGLDIFYRLGTSIEHTGKDFFYNTAVPADFEHAAEIFAGIVRHYNKGWADGHEWNIKYWGIWCEPDGIDFLWRLPDAEGGNDKEKMRDLYIKFFVTCLRRLKSEFPEIKVGGPDLCSLKVDYLKPLLQACKDANLAPDFISWHYYGKEPDAIVSQAEEARALCDEFGYTRCELVVDEWHYLGCSWKELRSSDPEVRKRVFSGPASPNGIDSACFTLSSLIKFQSSKIDQAYFYGCAHNGLWGYLEESGKNKNWYALCLFGDILKQYRGICASASMQNSVSTLAVKSSDGRKAALLVSDYRSTNTSITAEVKGVDLSKKPKAFVLSQKSNAEPCNVSWDGSKVLLEKPDKNSAAFMVVFDL